MNTDSGIRPVALALLGILFTVAYFWLFANSKVAKLLNFGVPRSEIVAKAEAAFQQSALAEDDLRKTVKLRLDKDLSHYAQISSENDSLMARLPIGTWVISWEGKVETEAGEKKNAKFSTRYDLNGSLLDFEEDSPRKAGGPNLSEAAAQNRAMSYLTTMGIDTATVELTQKKTSEKDGISQYTFSFTRASPLSADLNEQYEVEILGNKVSRLDTEVSLDEEDFSFAKSERTSDIVFAVLAAIVWVVVSIFLLVAFVKRVRHDELEFKRAVWLGGGVLVIMWTMVAINTWPEWEGVLLGGFFSAIFTGTAVFVAYVTAESLSREVWPEKLALTDVLFRGHLRVRELGKAILTAFFLTGLMLFVFGGLIWLWTRLDIGYVKIDVDNLWALQDATAAIAAVSGDLIGALLTGAVLLLFCPAFLRSKLNSKAAGIGLLGLIFVLSGLGSYFLQPSYLAFFLILPAGLLAAYFTYKYDFFTVTLSLLGFYYLMDLSALSFTPESFLAAPGIATAVLAIVLLLLGIILSSTKKSVKEYEDYVPEYVSRIAERERLLKELEIARSVQMQFLPQSIPSLPQLEIAGICRPAMEVGGDYYDFVSLGDERLSVLIGDVSGKGVSAAFYMTLTKGIIKTLARSIQSPKSLLTELNRTFYENTPKEVFISVIYGTFDMKHRTLTFARAGHNPLIVRKSAEGESGLLNPRGIAVGLETGEVFQATIEEKTIPIEPGDLIVFYTDGISEAMNKRGDEFGEERLRQTITRHAHEDAQTLLNQITAEVNAFAGDAKQHDDFTMVVVKVREDS